MPVAEIIAIGTELLLGEIQDTNTRYLARILRDSGINLYRTMMIGDNPERIAQVIQEAMARADIIITTGGLGPTVDDPTRQAVALALGVDIEFRPELWDQIQARFSRYNRIATDNNKRQAYIPIGATPIENQVGTAPAFLAERGNCVIISVPGVPREMEYLIENTFIPYLRKRYALRGVIKASVLHAAGIGESQIDEWIGDLETYKNPTVGLLAHPAQVDIRVTAKADSLEEADQMITEMSAEIKQRLGDNIFGTDTDTLEGITTDLLSKKGWALQVLEWDFGGELVLRMRKALPEMNGTVFDQAVEMEEMKAKSQAYTIPSEKSCLLSASLIRGKERQSLYIYVITPESSFDAFRSWGGPPLMGTAWAVNTAIDFLRRSIQNNQSK
jgi:nicotinamide-nucleotide amidase